VSNLAACQLRSNIDVYTVQTCRNVRFGDYEITEKFQNGSQIIIGAGILFMLVGFFIVSYLFFFLLPVSLSFVFSFLYLYLPSLGNACYYSVQNLLYSRLLSKNLKIKIYRTINCLLFCMGAKLGR
jgi:hypothetical protein